MNRNKEETNIENRRSSRMNNHSSYNSRYNSDYNSRYNSKYKSNNTNKKIYHHCVYIDDRKWYKIFKSRGDGKSLEDNFDKNKIKESLIVSIDDEEEGRMFTLFKDYLELYKYLKSIECTNFEVKSDYKSIGLFEVILGKKPQKPHFDIEIKRSEFIETYPDLEGKYEKVGDQLIKHIIESIDKVFSDNNVKLNINEDILYYTSHGVINKSKDKSDDSDSDEDTNDENKSNDDYKLSYHIVVNNHYHIDNEEAKAFYEKVKSNIKYFSEYIDHAVYSNFQQFRIVGCEKPGNNRPKLFRSKFKLGTKTYEHVFSDDEMLDIDRDMVIFKESLVSFTSNCKMLPMFSEIKKKNFTQNTNEITEEEANLAFSMLSDKHFYTIKDITNVIILKRLKPSYCVLCERIHQNENPFITIFKDNVYFYCRRNIEGKRIKLGTLYGKIDREIEKKKMEEEISKLPPCDINLDDFPSTSNCTKVIVKKDKEGKDIKTCRRKIRINNKCDDDSDSDGENDNNSVSKNRTMNLMSGSGVTTDNINLISDLSSTAVDMPKEKRRRKKKK